MEKSFKETQKFTQKWIYLIFGSIFLTSIYFVYTDYRDGFIDFNNFNTYKYSLSNFSIIIFAFLLVITSTLKTEVDAVGLRISYFPMFVKKDVKWDEISKATVIKYGFVGGWGVRLFTQYGIVYNVKGNKGLYVELKSGKKFLVGTQKEKELAEVVEQYLQE